MSKSDYQSLLEKKGQGYADRVWNISHPGERSPAQEAARQAVEAAGKKK